MSARTVLIVDDVPFVRRTISEILTAAHFRVVGEAGDGAEAVKLYAQLRPDLVTMDLVMPRIGGIEAIRSIRRVDKEALVLVISAMDQENLVMEAVNVGARDYLMKPFSAEGLLGAVQRILEGTGK